jgi:hypothetical protein
MPHEVSELADACQLPHASLKKMLYPDPNFLRADLQCVMCPACWLKDITEGRSPYIRLRWARPYALVCARHQIPLYENPLPLELSNSLMERLKASKAEWKTCIYASALSKRLCSIEACISGCTPGHRVIISDLLNLLTLNTTSIAITPPVSHMLDHYVRYYDDTVSKHIFNAPARRLPPKHLQSTSAPDLRMLGPIGYRRLLLYSAFNLLPAIFDNGALAYMDYFQAEALNSIEEKSKNWERDSLRSLMQVARTIAV